MKAINIDTNLSISEQIKLSDIKTLAAQGVKVLICNRPEGEEPNQLDNDTIDKEAKLQGIEFVHIPSPGREIPEESLALFVKTIKNCTSKVHAYCRTGARSSIFWGLSQAINLPCDAVLVNAKKVGLDLSGVESQLVALNKKSNITS